MKKEKHEFAIFTHETSRLTKKKFDYAVTDKDIINRITVILRLGVGETVIFFDQNNNARIEIRAIGKKEITIHLLEQHNNALIPPHLFWFLPLLEREAFEDSLTALTVMGVQEIYPLITEKSRKAWGSEKERDRAHRIMVAACEQSKQFCLPIIHEVIKIDDLEKMCKKNNITTQMFFDAQGECAFDVVAILRQKKLQSLACCVGPEGDLTQSEKNEFKKIGFIFCALTPTILRSSVAIEVGAGLLRSCL